MRSYLMVFLLPCLLTWGCSTETAATGSPSAVRRDLESAEADSDKGALLAEEGRHLRNLRRITNGGADAEAYFSADGKSIVFQSTRQGDPFDQIYTVGIEGQDLQRLSPGPGKTTCAFFFSDGEEIVYATTHFSPDAELREPDRSKGEAWIFDPAFDIVTCRRDGTAIKRLTSEPGYDAECACSRRTGRIVFCSLRTGDPELFTMKADGTDVKQLTFEKGYDGGPFFSVDGEKIIWRTYQPTGPEAEAQYDELISRNACGRWPFDIWMMDVDGSNKRRITERGEKEGSICWAPYLHPNNKQIVFVSSSTPQGRGRPNFDLYLVDVDGQNLERITRSPAFDGFPMFSDDGTRIAFVSSRAASGRDEVSVFVADWIP